MGVFNNNIYLSVWLKFFSSRACYYLILNLKLVCLVGITSEAVFKLPQKMLGDQATSVHKFQ